MRLPPTRSRIQVDRYGRISGAKVAPGSLPQNRVPRNGTLADLNETLGDVYAGTLYAGENEGRPGAARIILGDNADGLVIEDANGRPFVAFQWSGNIRAGMPGKLGWWLDDDGNVKIDGDCNVEGSITANRLVVGNFAKIVLEDDQIRVGEDLGEGYCGFLASINSIGGWYNGERTWYVENTTGRIVSVDANTETPDYVRTQIGGGYVDVFNLDGSNDSAGIRFRGYWYTEGDGYQYDEMLMRLQSMGQVSTLQLKNTDSDSAPNLQFVNRIDEILANVGPGGVNLLRDNVSPMSYGASGVFSQAADFYIRCTNRDLQTGQSPGFGRVVVHGNAAEFRHMTLRLTPDDYYGAVPQPADPVEGEFWWNPVDKRLEYYTGEKWVYIETSDVT